jgi:NADH:ubiquinone oxidoreductase subunit 4 (subunit M)
MGPVTDAENEKLRDLNAGQLAIMLSFILFILWIGIAPAAYFGLMDSSVSELVSDLSNTVLALGQ